MFFPPGPAYAESPPYNIMETVALVTEYYQLLQAMRYIGSDAIVYPPHDVNITLCETLGLTSLAINTLMLLPYIIPSSDPNSTLVPSDPDSHPGYHFPSRTILWRNGHFPDYRNDQTLWATRDSLHRREIDFPQLTVYETAMSTYTAIPKSAIPLSILPSRKPGLAIILDTSDGRLTVLDTQSFGSADPLIRNLDWENIPTQYRVGTYYYGYEVFARSAKEFLRELTISTALLWTGYLPGSVRTDAQYTPEVSPPKWEDWISDLYREYGWPSEEEISDRCYKHYHKSKEEGKLCEVEIARRCLMGRGFDVAMKEMRKKVEARYMRDWYYPVPRDTEVIKKLKEKGRLTAEQIAFAESDEPPIVRGLEG